MNNRKSTALYGLYGVTMESDMLLEDQLRCEGRDPDLRFSCGDLPPFTHDPDVAPVYASRQASDEGEADFQLFRQPRFDLLRIRDQAEFYLTAGSIHCCRSAGVPDMLVELYLLSAVFSLWLELRGNPALHAAAVESGGSALAFLADSGSGKTSIVGTFLREGFRLVTDDILALDIRPDACRAFPAFPQMRMWPGDAEYFLGSISGLRQVHPSSAKLRVPLGDSRWAAFCPYPVPLAAIYLLDRRPERAGAMSDPDIRISSVLGVEAVIEVIRKSFAAVAVESLGLQESRMSRFSALLRRVPVRRLSYPSGRRHLEQVCAAVNADYLRVRSLCA